jgi:hypothetical protein
LGRTWLKPIQVKNCHIKFLNIETGTEVLSERKNWTTLVHTGTLTFKGFGAIIRSSPINLFLTYNKPQTY